MRNIVAGVVLLMMISCTMAQYAYPCNVANCKQCSYLNVCGLCSDNYILNYNASTGMRYCEQVACNMDSCNKCYTNGVCAECASGFYMTNNGYCTSVKPDVTDCPTNCLACNSTTSCELCKVGYNIQNGRCLPNVNLLEDCMIGTTISICQVCNPKYLVNIAYGCQAASSFNCSVQGCMMCDAQNSCLTCLEGWQINSNYGCVELPCNVTNCLYCSSSDECSTCRPNYSLTSDNKSCILQSYWCDIQNCLYCGASNQCSSCMDGYFIKTLSSEGHFAGSSCIKYTLPAGYGNFNPDDVQHCSKLGAMKSGVDTLLTVGCIDCIQPFINVYGYCMANLTQQNYQCNVDNCVYCIQNNYCGQCGEGYTTLSSTGGNCWKIYSPIKNCKLTTLYVPACQACMDGYALTPEYQCQIIPPFICSIPGCNYCLEEGACSDCNYGYNLTEEGKCLMICNISDCYTCGSESTCSVCMSGFEANENSTECVSLDNITVNCSYEYDNCEQCNAYYCTKCESGYSLNNNTNACCASPVQNHQGCIQYEDSCSSTCLKCGIGYFKIDKQCVSLPCSVKNCVFCSRSDPSKCEACQEGYTWKDKQCTSFTIDNSCGPYCTNCQNGKCKECINGYQDYEGYCVCNFQNCISCIGDVFCKKCVYPTISTILNDPGCLPNIALGTICNVDNCLNCKIPNICAECDLGYNLQANGTCLQNQCDKSSNCKLCSGAQQLCFLCHSGYMQAQIFSPYCLKLSASYECEVYGCSVCNTSSTCQVCFQNFQLTPNQQCRPRTCDEFCLLCYKQSSCSLCYSGYYLTTDGKCAPDDDSTVNCTSIEYCISCSTDNTNVQCHECLMGLAPSEDKSECVPQTCSVPNCQLCLQQDDSTMDLCFVCEQGYFINSYFQCVKYSPAINTAPCNIYNCLYCYAEDLCGFCPLGWNSTDGMCQTNLFCSDQNCDFCTNATTCVTCAQNYSVTSLGSCSPLCNITYCASCATITTCGECLDGFVLSDDEKACNCNDTFVAEDDTCQCPANYTESDGSCYSCNINNCLVCNATNTCETCYLSYTLSSNECICEDTFVVQDGICTCPSGSKVYEKDGKSTCIPCNVTYCDSCSSQNQCASCLNTFNLSSSNTCDCASTFTVSDNVCVCPSGTKNYTEKCIACDIDYCSYCEEEDKCSHCIDTFQLQSNACQCPSTSYTISNNACYLCDNAQHCSICNGTNVCGQCKDSFVLSDGTCQCPTNYTVNSNEMCVECQVANCNNCQTANVCNTCSTLYNKVNGVCISCDVRSCKSCSSVDFCEECYSPLQVSSVGSCVHCQVTGCSLCSSNNVCIACDVGLLFNKYKTECVKCNVPGCVQCSSDNYCTLCTQGYNLNTVGASPSCDVCAYPCDTCNSNGSCASCLAPFSSTPNNAGSCYTCNVEHCKTCSSNDRSTCTQCEENYKISGRSCSIKCETNLCLECEDVSICTKCEKGYTPERGRCARCPGAPECISCSSSDKTTCTLCNEGYYLENGECYSCGEANCKTCNSTTCLTFKTSTKLIPFYNSTGSIVPVVCNPGCFECSSTNPDYCTKCYEGYSQQGGFCYPCIAPCKTCSNSNTSQCLSCYGNAFLSDSSCLTCNSSSNCLTCDSGNRTECTSCAYGYSMSSDKVCVKGCPNFCLACTNSTVCDVCEDGFAVTNAGGCVPCLSNCRKCSSNVITSCLQCGFGFYLNSEGVCKECTQFCDQCTRSGCQTCMSGYTLTSSFKCVTTCTIPCATCSDTSPTKCNSCIGGYALDSTTSVCQPVVNDCPNNICEVCPFNYVLSGNQCLSCTNSDSQCARCSVTDTSKCTSCLDGQYLSGGNCIACQSQCETCSSGSYCLSCATGYTAAASPVHTVKSCVKCTQPCATCYGNAATCTSCISKYQLVGWKCVSTFNYGFKTTLNTTLSDFYTKYYNFLEAIAGSQQTNQINITTLLNITEGSVVVKGNITTSTNSDSNEASVQFENLTSVLSAGSIAGMDIIRSDISPNGGTVPSDSGPNLALILGICIPLAVIIIGLIIYFACVRPSKSPPPTYSEKNMEPGTSVRQTFQIERGNTQKISNYYDEDG